MIPIPTWLFWILLLLACTGAYALIIQLCKFVDGRLDDYYPQSDGDCTRFNNRVREEQYYDD